MLDYISSKIGLYGTSSLGLFLTALGGFLMAPLISILNNIFILIIGFGLLGAGQAPIFIPLLIALSKCIIKIEKNIDELTANDIATSLNNVFVGIGEFSGPIIGGSLTSYFGFNYCCFFISIFIFIYFIMFIYYFYNEIFNKYNNKENEEYNNNSDNNKIIKNFSKSFTYHGKILLLNNNEEKSKIKRNTISNFENNSNDIRISLFSALTK